MSPAPTPPRPVAARLDQQGALVLDWSDGLKTRHIPDALRAACRCAICVDEITGEVRVKREDFADIALQDLSEVGRYAFRFVWSDQHATGIHSFDRLRTEGELMPSADSDG